MALDVAGKASGPISLMLALLLAGCTPGKHAFLTIQLCLENQQGLTLFKQEMRAIASAEGMRYVDRRRGAK